MIASKEVVMTMNKTTDNTKKWQEDAALERFRLIAPLLDESIDPAKRLILRKEIARSNGLTTRSLYRYEAAYRADGFAGLKPMNRESAVRSPFLRTSMNWSARQSSSKGKFRPAPSHRSS